VFLGDRGELRELKSEVRVLQGRISTLEKLVHQNQECLHHIRENLKYWDYSTQIENLSRVVSENQNLIERIIKVTEENQVQIGEIKNNQIVIMSQGVSNTVNDMSVGSIDQRINSGEINMSDIQQKDGDTYNVGQAGAVGKYARSDENTFIQSEQKQPLEAAAKEIQNLLRQLEQTNPSATQSEMVAYVNDETTPRLKRQTSSALRACGEAAIDEFVLENKFLKVIKATVKGWLEADF
jgi:hypothetical protein